MRVAYTHNSNRDDVRRRLDEEAAKALAQAQGKVAHASYAWRNGEDVLDFTVTAMGATVNGTAEVTDTEVIVEAQLPLFLRAFEGRAKSRILDTFRAALGPPRT
jgi:hypothetical protein